MLQNELRLIGIRIMQKRKEKRLTQEQLAEKLDITSGHLSCIERGKYTPTVPLILNICEILGETPNYYLVGEVSVGQKDEFVSKLQKLPKPYQKFIESATESLVDTYIASREFD